MYLSNISMSVYSNHCLCTIRVRLHVVWRMCWLAMLQSWECDVLSLMLCIQREKERETGALALTECTMEHAMRQECQYTLWALPGIRKHAAEYRHRRTVSALRWYVCVCINSYSHWWHFPVTQKSPAHTLACKTKWHLRLLQHLTRSTHNHFLIKQIKTIEQ